MKSANPRRSDLPKHLTIRSYFLLLTNHCSESFIKRRSKFSHATRARKNKKCEWTMFNFSHKLLKPSFFSLPVSCTHLAEYQNLIWRKDWLLKSASPDANDLNIKTRFFSTFWCSQSQKLAKKNALNAVCFKFRANISQRSCCFFLSFHYA